MGKNLVNVIASRPRTRKYLADNPTLRRTRVRPLAATLAVAAVATLGGTVTSVAVGAQAKTTLKVWTLEFQGGNQGFQNLVNDFEKAYPNVTVQYTYLPDNDYKTKILPALKTSAGPDVFEAFNGASFAGTYVADHAVVPLNKYYAEYNWKSRWTPATIATAYSANGQLYGVPNVASATCSVLSEGHF